MQKVIVIGMGMSSRDMTEAQLEMVRSADVLMGGRRHLDQFDALGMEKMVISGKITEAVGYIRRHMAERRIVVLASGDPLFFGIGARITEKVGRDRVTVLPNISSIAVAFARINEPWGDARIVSLHGRERQFQLLAAMKNFNAVAVFTDLKRTPGWLAGWLLDRGVDKWQMAVFEQLGASEEKFGWYDLDQAVARTFAQPNVVILKRSPEADASRAELHVGMPEEAFRHERGLITKSEVRAVTLGKLALQSGQTLWDLGAGSGSVGIEAAAMLGHGRIIAVERNEDRIAQIRDNARQYGLYNHEAVQAHLPEGLDALPRPDRIFIGGGGRDLPGIIHRAVDFLPAAGVLVANTVLVDSLTAAIAEMEAKGLTTEVVQIQIGRSKAMPWSLRFEAQNPVWIMTGHKPES